MLLEWFKDKTKSFLMHVDLSLNERVYLKNLLDEFNQVCSQKNSRPHLGIQRFLLKKWLGTPSNSSLIAKYADSTLLALIRKQLGVSPKTIAVTGAKLTSEKTKSTLTTKETQTITKRVKIESIEILNFKTIENLTITFPSPPLSKYEPWLMLLGENGVGKSSFLQAVALTLMGTDYLKSLKIKPQNILRHGEHSGYVKVHRTGQLPIELHFTKTILQSNIKQPHSFLLGYGSTRLFPTPLIKVEKTKNVRTRNLFHPDSALFADDWLLQQYASSKKKFDFACRALKSMLSKELKDPNVEFKVRNKEVYLYYSDKKKQPDKLKELSDGYKSIIALACDMMQALMLESNTMEIAEGIVLIDEIGTHLHPSWKMRVVSSFREAFPRLQFIVTTHDHLCLKGLKAGEVIVLEKQQGKIVSIGDLPDPGEFRADQLLSSRFFGLNSTIDPDLENDFNEYYWLLGKIGLTKKESSRLEQLKELLKGKKHLGESLREELALTAADKVLAEDKASQTNKSTIQLAEQTETVLKELWSLPINNLKK